MRFMAEPGDTRLITIAASHYCEKARWALERARLPFVEDAYPPVFHWRATACFGRRQVPILVTPSKVLTDSTDILAYVDTFVAPGERLYPVETGLRSRVVALEDEFDEKLGPAVRRVAYFHLLDAGATFERVACAGARSADQWAFRGAGTLARAVLRRGLRVDLKGAMRSRERIDALFTKVAGLLADGRRCLTGDCFTAADLTFAALTGPLLFPDGYGGPLLRDVTHGADALPAGLASERDRYREHVAGQFALRVYRDERIKSV